MAAPTSRRGSHWRLFLRWACADPSESPGPTPSFRSSERTTDNQGEDGFEHARAHVPFESPWRRPWAVLASGTCSYGRFCERRAHLSCGEVKNMKDNSSIRRLVDAFVDQITAALTTQARDEARAEVLAALGTANGQRGP